MTRTTKRLFAATAALAATSLALTACGGDGGDGGGGGDGTLQVIVLKHALTGAMADMAWVSDLEEMAGVMIEWEEVSADWDQKKSTMLAAGDMPDLVIGTNTITNADQATFAGLFEDLSDDLDSLPNVAAMFEAHPETEAMATSSDGGIYGLPSYRRFWPLTGTRQFINQQWLDNVGMDVPTTWDELHEVLLAFKEQDANGNGDPNDEIPMDWAPAGDTGFGLFMPSMMLGGLGMSIANGGGEGYIVEDGQVSNFFIDERYRDLIAFLHELYADGLISQDVMTQDYSAYQSVARGNGDTAAVGFTWGWTASDRVGAQLADQYTATAPLLADESMDPADVRWSFDSYSLNYGVNSITMSAQSDNREAALAVIDAFYDQDISIQALWGEFGENIEKTGDNSYEVLPPADGETDPSTWKWTTTLADNSPGWIRDDIEVVLPSDLEEAAVQSEPLDPAVEAVDPETDIFPTELIRISEEDLNTLALNNTAVFNIAMQRWATWITEGGVEAEWDAYVEEVSNVGLSQNIEIHQGYYDEFVAS